MMRSFFFLRLQGGTSQASREAPRPRSHACWDGSYPHRHAHRGANSARPMETATLQVLPGNARPLFELKSAVRCGASAVRNPFRGFPKNLVGCVQTAENARGRLWPITSETLIVACHRLTCFVVTSHFSWFRPSQLQGGMEEIQTATITNVCLSVCLCACVCVCLPLVSPCFSLSHTQICTCALVWHPPDTLKSVKWETGLGFSQHWFLPAYLTEKTLCPAVLSLSMVPFQPRLFFRPVRLVPWI